MTQWPGAGGRARPRPPRSESVTVPARGFQVVCREREFVRVRALEFLPFHHDENAPPSRGCEPGPEHRQLSPS